MQKLSPDPRSEVLLDAGTGILAFILSLLLTDASPVLLSGLQSSSLILLISSFVARQLGYTIVFITFENPATALLI